MIYALLGPVRTIKLVFTFIFRTQCLLFSSCPIKRTKIILKLQLKFFLKLPKTLVGTLNPGLGLGLGLERRGLGLGLPVTRGLGLGLGLGL